MLRGFVWGEYQTNDGTAFALQVDANYLAMPERGWVAATTGEFPLPRGWIPRRVFGIDDLGRVQFAIAATLAADIWTGVASTFTILGTDDAPHTCTIFKRVDERTRNRP